MSENTTMFVEQIKNKLTKDEIANLLLSLFEGYSSNNDSAEANDDSASINLRNIHIINTTKDLYFILQIILKNKNSKDEVERINGILSKKEFKELIDYYDDDNHTLMCYLKLNTSINLK